MRTSVALLALILAMGAGVVAAQPGGGFRYRLPAGVAPPVKSVFYGGEHYGYAFIYPKGEPNLTPPPVAAQPEIILTPNVTEAAPVVAAAAPTTEPATPVTGPAPTEPVVASTPEAAVAPEATLPATASRIPLMALGGFASLVFGLGVGLLRRRA